jgi:SanA protein
MGTTHSMRNRRKRWVGALMAVLIGGLVAAPFALQALVAARYASSVLRGLEGPPGYSTAVVFGAAIRNGQPTTVLRDRLDKAVELYRRGGVTHLILSGDGRAEDYDEPGAMQRYAMQQGVPETAITLDRAGLRTFDSCFRLREIYQIQQAVLVTQAFHLPRALFTCELLGIDAIGVAADKRVYRSAGWYDLREFFALTVAAWDVLVQELSG